METTDNNLEETTKQTTPDTTSTPQTGLDNWNDRLDENLEGENQSCNKHYQSDDEQHISGRGTRNTNQHCKRYDSC